MILSMLTMHCWHVKHAAKALMQTRRDRILRVSSDATLAFCE
jgi:hypothetical protein